MSAPGPQCPLVLFNLGTRCQDGTSYTKAAKNVEVGTLCLTGDICLFVVRRHVLGQEMTQFE